LALPTDNTPLQCLICTSDSEITRSGVGHRQILINCSRCGIFEINEFVYDKYQPKIERDQKTKALLSYNIRKLQKAGRATVSEEFIAQVLEQSLPSPAEATDNLLLDLVVQTDGQPGRQFIVNNEPKLLSTVGAVQYADINWLIGNLETCNWVRIGSRSPSGFSGQITGSGWTHYEELKRAHAASKYAFFARRFANDDLDKIYEESLKPAVKETGYELRIVSQQAGLIDAIMEDEIRRCRFLIADLTDESPGAYWEAGFAEGLGKPVIYICAENRQTHFDTNHRHTIPWSLSRIDETARRLKAVIRNTLLGDAIQEDHNPSD
jgi:hypothetical protein